MCCNAVFLAGTGYRFFLLPLSRLQAAHVYRFTVPVPPTLTLAQRTQSDRSLAAQ